MIIEAGTRLHMNGFDWTDDSLLGTTPKMFGRQLPVIYATWAKAMPGGIERAEELIGKELAEALELAAWTRESLRESLLDPKKADLGSKEPNSTKRCSSCETDYTALGVGLVAPAWIAFTESTSTNHRFRCDCATFLLDADLTAKTTPPPIYTPRNDPPNNTSPTTKPEDLEDPTSDDGDSSDSEEDVFQDCESGEDEELYADESSFLEMASFHAQTYLRATERDPFRDTATILYRAQGRTWLGSYEPSDLLCTTCFLKREEYIGKEGLGKDPVFSQVPASYAMFGPDSEERWYRR